MIKLIDGLEYELFAYANLSNFKMKNDVTYGIKINDKYIAINRPVQVKSIDLADGSILNSTYSLSNTMQIYTNADIMDYYFITVQIINGVKLNSSYLYELDMTQSVLFISIAPYGNSVLTINKVSIDRFDLSGTMPIDNEYTLEQLPLVTLSAEGIYKERLMDLQIGFTFNDKMNRLIDRSVSTPYIARNKFFIKLSNDIRLDPGETLTFDLGYDFVKYINNPYEEIYDSDYSINALGTKSVLVKINNICFAIFGKNDDGTYNDTIVGTTTLPSIMLKCGNGFTIYERTEGSRLAMSIMDDGRVDLNNIGTDSIVIPQFTDSSLDSSKLSKYNFIYFEVNLFNHNTISRNDYGFMVSRPNFNFWKETSLNYYNASASYKSLLCDECVWYDNTQNVFAVHVDFDRLAYLGNREYMSCDIQQLYIKEPHDKCYRLVYTTDSYYYSYNMDSENGIANISNKNVNRLTNGFDIVLIGQDAIKNLKYGQQYNFSVKVVDINGNSDIHHYKIIPTNEMPPVTTEEQRLPKD